jgi:Zn-dependent metalloprotease
MATMRYCLVLLFCGSTTVIGAWAQASHQPALADQQTKTTLEKFKDAFPTAKVTLDPNGMPQTITGLDSVKEQQFRGKDASDAVRRFFETQPVKQLFQAALNSGAQATVEEVERHIDPVSPERTIITVRQKIAGIPVFGGEARLIVNQVAPAPNAETGKHNPKSTQSIETAEAQAQAQATFVISRVQSAFRDLTADVVTTHEITQEEAQSAAAKAYSAILSRDEAVRTSENAFYGPTLKLGKSELVMFDPSSLGEPTKGLRPTWIVTVGTYVFFVDANSGVLIHKYRELPSLASFEVKDYANSSVNSTLVLNESGTIAGSQAVVPEATLAINNAVVARSFYQNLHRTFLGTCLCNPDIVAPEPVDLNIRFGGTMYSYWLPPASSAFFADGYAAALDVVGHELGHGITTFAVCLTFDSESGAVSEFLSDFFAAMIRQKAGLNPWTIGDTLPHYQSPKPPLRNMGDPHQPGFHRTELPSDTNRGQPQTIEEKVDNLTPICANDTDNSCAHLNSGILNMAAYLAVTGGQLSGITVRGIGYDKMLNLVNKSISSMTNVMSFNLAYNAIQGTCDSLAEDHEDGIDVDDCQQIRNAFQAVGVPFKP